MLTSQLVTGLLFGLDSFLVCLAVGTLPERSVRRLPLALSFGLCDGLASWIGSVAGMEPLRAALLGSEWLGPGVVAGYGCCVLVLAWRCHDRTTRLGTGHWLVFSLPLGLSLDNLIAGVGAEAAGATPVLSALIFGAISGGLALLGMRVGSALRASHQFRTAWLSGALLILVAGGLILKDALLE